MPDPRVPSHPFVPRALVAAGAVLLGLPLVAVGCSGDTPADGPRDHAARADVEAIASIPQHPHKAVCAEAPPGYARCHAHVRVDDQGNVVTNATPSGYGPADVVKAYDIPSGGGGITVAIVDAYDDPNAESDLGVYRSQFGLPPCTTANGCFKKVNQSGGSQPPPANTGWAEEISLDLAMVSAACPACKITLVEANSALFTDLGAAVNKAVALGATVVSNSYGGRESAADGSYDAAYFNHPGVTLTVSSGDGAYGVEYPASSAYVVAVGGTSLLTSTSTRGWIESAWPDGGSGCSAYTKKPSFQTDTGCAMRTVADISAVADPNTGVAVYDTYGEGGWLVFGGTSVASPLVAAILAATGNAGVANAWPYAHTGDFYDVTAGSNGKCSPSYLCTAGAGYDGPTGWGTPNGKAIQGSSSSSSSTSSSSTSTSSGSSTSTSSSSSSGGSTCSHSVCTSGPPLAKNCSPCATEVCNMDPSCCRRGWTSLCVSIADFVCGGTCN